MSKLIDIKFDALVKLVKSSEEIRKNAIKSALVYSMMQARDSAIKYTRKELKKSGQINLDLDKFKKRVRRGKQQVDISSTVPQLYTTIDFSIFDEALSSFPYKKEKIIGKNGRKFIGIAPIIMGKKLKPSGTFLRLAKKGKAVQGSLLSLARTGSDRKVYEKQKVKVSISDILLNDKSLFERITNKTLDRYHNRLSVNMNYYINRELERARNGY